MGPPSRSSWSSLVPGSTNQRLRSIIHLELELELNAAKDRPLGEVQHRLGSINTCILEMAHDRVVNMHDYAFGANHVARPWPKRPSPHITIPRRGARSDDRDEDIKICRH
jgi:hypothetical protein